MYIKMTFTYIVGPTKDLTLRDLCQIEEKKEKKEHWRPTSYIWISPLVNIAHSVHVASEIHSFGLEIYANQNTLIQTHQEKY